MLARWICVHQSSHLWSRSTRRTVTVVVAGLAVGVTALAVQTSTVRLHARRKKKEGGPTERCSASSEC